MKPLTMLDFVSDFQHIVVRCCDVEEIRQQAFNLIEDHYKHLHSTAWLYVLSKTYDNTSD